MFQKEGFGEKEWKGSVVVSGCFPRAFFLGDIKEDETEHSSNGPPLRDTRLRLCERHSSTQELIHPSCCSSANIFKDQLGMN
jgi:hypothetical protein